MGLLPVTDLLHLQGPMPFLGCYLPMLSHVNMLILCQWLPFAQKAQSPQYRSQPQLHGVKTSMSSNIPLQLHQMVALTQKVTPGFCSGPLSFRLGLLWGTKGNLAL